MIGGAILKLVSEPEDIPRSKQLGDEASAGERDTLGTSSREAEASAPTVAEQSVLESYASPVAESRPRRGLVDLLARITTDPRAVHAAWLDLRSMIEAVVRREIQGLETRIGARIDGLESELKSIRSELVITRWILGIFAALGIGLLGVVIAMFIFFATDRMDSRPEIDPVEQTRDATSPAPGKVMADEPAVSASGVDLGIDAEPTGTPAAAGPPASRDTR